MSEEKPRFSDGPICTRKVTLSQKVYLGFASVGANILNMVLWGALMSYYLDFLHLDPALYGTVILLYGFWNAINDPLLGYLSDKRKPQKNGAKRIIFLKLGIPIYLIGFFLIWIPSVEWTDLALFIILFIGLFLFDTAHTAYVLNHCAIQTSLTEDPNERASINFVITYVGAIPYALIGFVPTYILTSGLPREEIFLILGICGAIAAVFMIIGTWKIRENSIVRVEEDPLPLKAAIQATFSSRSFLIFLVYSFAMGGVAMTLGQIAVTYLKNVFDLSGFPALVPGAVAGVVQMLLYPLIDQLNRRKGLRFCLLIFIGVTMVGYLGLMLTTSFPLMVFFYGCCQWGAGCHWVLFNAMIGDITDEDELKTHQRREGAFFGVNALIAAPAQSILIWLFTLIIRTFGYSAAFGETPDLAQVPRAILGIRLGVGLMPLIFLCLGFIAMWCYPLHGQRYQTLKHEILVLHQRNKT